MLYRLPESERVCSGICSYFKPEEWTDKDGVKHNRIVMVANKFYPTPDKEEAPAEPEKKTKKGKK